MSGKTVYAIEMQDKNGVWTDSLGVGREKFDTIGDARDALEDLHRLPDESYSNPGRIVDWHTGEVFEEVQPFDREA